MTNSTQQLWDHATESAKLQHPTTGCGARFPVPGTMREITKIETRRGLLAYKALLLMQTLKNPPKISESKFLKSVFWVLAHRTCVPSFVRI